MGKLFNKNISAPFDDIKSSPMDFLKEESGPVVNAGRDGLSFRSSVFMVTCIASFCWIFAYCSRMWLSLGVCLAYLVIWGLVFAFFESKRLVCLNLILNVALAAVPCAIFHSYFDSNLFFAMVPVVLGVTTLGSCPSDGRQLYEKVSTGDFFILLVISFISSGVIEPIMRLMHITYLTPRIMVSSLIVMLFTFLESNLLNSETLLSGRTLSGSALLPKTDPSTLATFVSGRLVFAGVSLASLAVAMGAAYLSAMYSNLNPVCIRALACALVFCVFNLVTKNTRMPFEAFIAIILFARSDTLTTYLLVIALDILFRGYISVTRRRSIFHTRNKFADGIPVMLMTVSVFIMVAECCL